MVKTTGLVIFNNMPVLRLLIPVLCLSFSSLAQQLEMLASGSTASLRGLSVVSEKLIWVSGSNGTAGRSTDGGTTWQWLSVPGYESKDFRDIEAFDASTAIIMAVGEPGLILKTTDGGRNWKKVYENTSEGMFLDAMEFWNPQSGIVIGNPLNGRFFIARSFDGGDTWQEIGHDKLPLAGKGEAFFAASGTNVRALAPDEACFVTGGSMSRFFWKGEPVVIPVVQGKESAGANSVAVWKKRKNKAKLVVVGGDFTADTMRIKNCAVSQDGGQTWIPPYNPPYGYRSCVEFMSSDKLITCGTNGVDVSVNGGMNWNNISLTGFHVCRKAKKGKVVFLAGANGKIGKLVW